MSSRCESCDSVMSSRDMFRTVELEDGSKKEIIDNLCNSCINQYVYAADLLQTHSYQHERITDLLWEDIGEGTLGNYGAYL